MELRFQTARTTKDLDFTARIPWTGRVDVLLKRLQDAGAVDLCDFFSYRIGEATMVTPEKSSPQRHGDPAT